MFRRLIVGLGVWLMAMTGAQAADTENTLYLDLKDGRVVIEMRPDLAPSHVKRIKELVRQGFYDGIVFHRVIDGFMAQTGDPTGTGMGGSGQKLNAEFNDAPHLRGTVSMARTNDPNGADSQFFIMLADQHGLDGQYTVWGRVAEGMEYVDNIKKGDSADNGKVADPDKIIRLRVAADVANESQSRREPGAEETPPTASAGPATPAGTASGSQGAAAPTAQEIRPEDAEPAAGGQKVLYVPSGKTPQEASQATSPAKSGQDAATPESSGTAQ